MSATVSMSNVVVPTSQRSGSNVLTFNQIHSDPPKYRFPVSGSDRNLRQLLLQTRARQETSALRNAYLKKLEKASGDHSKEKQPNTLDQSPGSAQGSIQNSVRRPKSRKKVGQWAFSSKRKMSGPVHFPEIKTKSLHGDGWMSEILKVVPERIPISTPVNQQIDYNYLNMKMLEKARTGQNSSPSTYFYFTSSFRRNDFEIHPEWFSEKLYVKRFSKKPEEMNRPTVPRLSLSSPRNDHSHQMAPQSARVSRQRELRPESYRPVHSAR